MEQNRKSIDEMLQILSEAPDTQIDKTVTKRLKKLIGKPLREIRTEVVHVIDDCVYFSLSSGFVLQTLHILHKNLLDGTDEDFNDENCPWRDERNGNKLKGRRKKLNKLCTKLGIR